MVHLFEFYQTEGIVIDEKQTVIVRDPKSKQLFEICDSDVYDHVHEKPHPHDYPGLECGLMIYALNELGIEISGIELPRLPDYVNARTLYPIQDILPRDIRRLARQLERAVIEKNLH